MLRLCMLNKIMTSKRCPHSNPWNLWDMLHYMSRSYLTDLEMGRFSWIIHGPDVIRRVLSRGKQEVRARDLVTILVALKIKEGVISHGMQAVHKLGKARKQIVPGAPRRKAALLMP